MANNQYLTFVALEDGTFSFSGAVSVNTLSYSLDSGLTWTTLQNSGTTPTVTSGNTILWKASGLTISNRGIGRFSSTGQFEAEGNIMSLLFGDDFSGQTSLSGKDDVFAYLFFNCVSITSAENLVLPATTLASSCYAWMFSGCTSLKIPPKLLATKRSLISTTEEYREMFKGCTSLEQIPEFPKCSVDFDQYTYTSMFENCTSLKHVTYPPHIPIGQCMFTGCTSLSAVTCISTSGRGNYQWLKNVSNSGIFYKDKNASWSRGEGGIPSNWEVADFGSGIYKKYHVAKEQYRLETGGTWTDTDPLVTEISGDPIARYATLSECEAVTAITRWVESGTTCNNGNKYQNNIKEQSTDGGETWTVVIPEEYSASTLIESDSYDCGYRTGTTSSSTYCNGDDLYVDVYYRTSRDSGTTWITASTTPTLVEAGGCATPASPKFALTLSDSSVVTAECDSTSAVTSSEVLPYSGTARNIEIGECVETIGWGTFRNFTALTSVTLSQYLTTINDYAFAYSTGLTTINIPNSVEYVGERAFDGCSNLPTYNGVRYADTCAVLAVNDLSSYDLKNGIRFIGTEAFAWQSNLRSMVIPGTVAGINSYAFRGCNSLTSVTIPNGISYIGEAAFYDCNSLVSANIPVGLKTIPTHCFHYCNLTSVTIPDSVEIIGDYAFSDNYSLENVEIPSGVTYFGDLAFGSCVSLQSITFHSITPPTNPNELTFDNCESLAYIYVPAQSVDAYKETFSYYSSLIYPIPT